jgi:CubicO group peptidase (beta-lactamase class C family)
MALQRKVKLDEPVRALLPPGTLGPPKGEEITLLDLATQHSGLPRMPDNFHPANDANPYADYSAAKLYAYLRAHGDAHPAQAGFLYSNLGFGLLGQGLSVRAGMPYAALMRQEVAVPLGLKDTVVALSPDQRRRLLPGHDAQHHVVQNWDLNALSGAGAIRSTAEDMLSYLEANLHPDQLRPEGGTAAARTIAAALTSQHVLRADAGPSMRIGMAWLHFNDGGPYWHNGATGGYSSYAFFSPECDCAAVVLVNTAPGAGGGYADRVGEHIYQRLTGKAALSLAH